MKRFLITGGAGFIGSHLAERLVADGHEVFIIDDLSTGRMGNIRSLKKERRFHYHIDTINNEPLLAELIDEVGVVFHLAAAVGVRRIIERPVQTIETNIHGTELVLKHAAKKRKLVFLASSSEVYGKSDRVPFREDDDMVLGPTTKSRWSYACSKAIDEFLALSYHRERGLPVIIGRLFNIAGPRQVGDYGMVLPRFMESALRGRALTVYGTGRQVRCFLDVADLVEALVRLIRERRAVGRVFNIGNDEPVSINALARLVKQNVNPRVRILHMPYEKAYERGFEDLKVRVPDISRLRSVIEFEPRYELAETIERIVKWKTKNIE
jgi:UDP-glucose 4-epimerase